MFYFFHYFSFIAVFNLLDLVKTFLYRLLMIIVRTRSSKFDFSQLSVRESSSVLVGCPSFVIFIANMQLLLMIRLCLYNLQAKKQKPKYMYKTAKEVLETGGKRAKPAVETLPKVKVIDMTGREQRVLSGGVFIIFFFFTLFLVFVFN